MSFVGNLDHALERLRTTRQARVINTAIQQPTASGTRSLGIRSVYAQSQVMYTQPQFYSPLHTPQNWQIPTKRREVLSWLRYFAENEPKVAAALSIYSSFPLNGFETQCEDSKIKRYYDSLNKKLNLDHWCQMISREYFLVGDVFPFLQISCDKCKSTNVLPNGKLCNHPGGTFSRMVCLNPDWIDVQRNQLSDDPVITMIPDDELKRTVFQKRPKALYDALPVHIRQLILSGKPFPLDNRNVSHIMHDETPYGTYGSSLIRRLFKVLTYKDKLMTAQWIVAERLILPIRVVKVGSEERPAGPSDIADIQQQLAQTANDPNLTLVTHHNFEYEWIGCFSTNDNNNSVLCKDGLKHYKDLTESDLIATWNQKNKQVEYQKYIRKVEFKYDKSNSSGYAYRIGVKNWNFLATPNHRHYMVDGTIKRSDELKIGDTLLMQNDWKWDGGVIPETLPFKERKEFSEFSLKEFCRFAGYYVAEGNVKKEGNKNLCEAKKIQCFAITQEYTSPIYNDMLSLCKKISPTLWVTHDPRGRGETNQIQIGNASLSRWLAEQFGDGSYFKKFPGWMMELPTEYLKIIWDSMYAGDGCKGRKKYTTASSRLCGQVCNMLVKFGKSPHVTTESGITKKGKRYTTCRIAWAEMFLAKIFRLTKIEKVPYEGDVWCLETPNHNFFVKAGNQILLTGNSSGKVLTLSNEFEFINKEILQGLMVNEALLSGEMGGYASAAIGAEMLIARMESWRQGTLARWIEEKIYKPVAQMRGFVDEAATEELGEPVWLYPKIKWNDLNIRDDTQQKQIWMQAYDKKIMSAESLCEKLDLHYDQEVERIRLETAQTTIGGPPGGAGGMGGAPGGEMGGMGGGGGVGGAPPGGLFGGEAGAGGPPPGGPMGAPGDTGMGGTGMGSPVGGAPAAAGSMGKIMTKGHAAKQMKPMAEEAAQPTGVKLTSLEQIMYKLLSEMKYGMRLPFNPWVQYPLGPYRADFAIPQLRLAIECDGFAWHSLPDKKAKDQMRDAQLAKYGWTTVRFSEVDLKENLKEVQKTVAALIFKLWKKAHEDQAKKGKGKVAMTDPAMFKKAETMDTGDFEFMDLAQKYGMVSVPLGVVSMEAIDLMAQEDPYIKPEQRLEAVWGAATTPIVKEAEVKTEAKESDGA